MSDVNVNRLRLARERAGLSQVDLSQRLGVAKTLAGQWERGEREPSLGNLKALAKALRVRVGWLVDDENESEVLPPLNDRDPIANRRLHSSRESVTSDYVAPVGLRDLAQDAALCKALSITESEWSALSSLEFEAGLTAEGYLGLLVLVRAVSVADRRAGVTAGAPGRPTIPLGSQSE